jgi:hypothetical protein
MGGPLLQVGEHFEEVQQEEDDVLADDLWQLFVRVHHQDAVVGTEGRRVDEDRMRVPLDLILLSVFVEKALGYLVGLSIQASLRFLW